MGLWQGGTTQQRRRGDRTRRPVSRGARHHPTRAQYHAASAAVGAASWTEPAGIPATRFSGRARLLHFLLGILSWDERVTRGDRNLQPAQHPADVSALGLTHATHGAPQSVANPDPGS